MSLIYDPKTNTYTPKGIPSLWTSVDPKTRMGTDAQDSHDLKELIRAANLLIEAAHHTDGPGDVFKRNWRSAWRFVKKVAGLKKEG